MYKQMLEQYDVSQTNKPSLEFPHCVEIQMDLIHNIKRNLSKIQLNVII